MNSNQRNMYVVSVFCFEKIKYNECALIVIICIYSATEPLQIYLPNPCFYIIHKSVERYEFPMITPKTNLLSIALTIYIAILSITQRA